VGRRATFADREEAGRRLAGELPALERPIVLGLPRGGVPVAAAVAAAIGAPLDVFVVRKLGLPAQPELAMGAVASGGARILNDAVLREGAVPRSVLDEVTARERAEVESRERLFRQGRGPLSLAGRDVVLVDDGVATGASIRVALEAVRAQRPGRVLAAVPVAPASTVASLRAGGIDVAVVVAAESFAAVGEWYRNFTPTTDEEVIRLLDRFR
jgi:predicted phosphoribosyltransferase